EDDERSLAGDYVLMANLTIQRVVERLAIGEIEPEISDGATMAKLLLDLERQDQDTLDRAAIGHAMATITAIVKEHVSPEEFQRIGHQVATDPRLKALNAAVARGPVIDVESA